MNNRFKLSIDNPCSQKWTDFEDRGDRGFCASCQKEVIDFTRLSDSEIRNYFKNRPKNVCGQFKSYQLRTYSNPTASSGLSKWLSWPIAASALMFTSISAQAQKGDKKEQVENVDVNQSSSIVGENREVLGKVTDDSGEGLPGVNVVIKGTTGGVTTDMDGNYKIKILGNEAALVFSSVGMATQEVATGSRSVVDVGMSMDTRELGEVIVGGAGYYASWYTPRGIWGRTRGLFRRIF